LERTGVSEVLAVLMLSGLFLGAGVAYLSMVQRGQKGQTVGLLEAMRLSQHRVNQLLTCVYSSRSPGLLSIYLYNYGTENAGLAGFYYGAQSVRPYSFRDAETGSLLGESVVPPKRLVRVDLPPPPSGENHLTVVTEVRTVFTWLV
jgi:hypothetical protein